MLLIEVKGHADMSPRQNFSRGGKPKRVPLKQKQHPHMEKKSSRKAFKCRKKAPHKKKNVSKRPPHREKSRRKAFKW